MCTRIVVVRAELTLNYRNPTARAIYFSRRCCLLLKREDARLSILRVSSTLFMNGGENIKRAGKSPGGHIWSMSSKIISSFCRR